VQPDREPDEERLGRLLDDVDGWTWSDDDVTPRDDRVVAEHRARRPFDDHAQEAPQRFVLLVRWKRPDRFQQQVDRSIVGSTFGAHPDAPDIPLTVLINFEVTPLAPELEDDWEGCLSLIDFRGRTPRYRQVRARFLDRQGRPVEFVATGFHARVLQHERDHLLGKVFIDRMPSFETLSYLSEFARYWNH